MYKAFFGFKQSPFSMSPDPAFLFRSEQHEEALANLIYGVQSRKGFAVCDNLLLTAFAMESRTATLEMLDEVTADMRLEYPGKPGCHGEVFPEPVPGPSQAPPQAG